MVTGEVNQLYLYGLKETDCGRNSTVRIDQRTVELTTTVWAVIMYIANITDVFTTTSCFFIIYFEYREYRKNNANSRSVFING